MKWGHSSLLSHVGLFGLVLSMNGSSALALEAASGLADPVVDSCMQAMPALPPNFNDAVSETNQQMAQACVRDQLLGTLFGAAESGVSQECMNVMTGGSFVMGSFSMQTVCPANTNPNASFFTCNDVGGEGNFDEYAFQALMANNQASLAGSCCRMAKMNLVQQNLQCMTRQARALTEQMSRMKLMFQQEITARAACRDRVNETIMDRTAQVAEIEQMLGGDQGGGTTGLLAMQQRVREAIQRMPAEINDLEKQQRALIEKKRGFEEEIQVATSQQALACFTQPGEAMETYRCDGGADSAPTSAMGFAECIYRQRAQYDSNGRMQQGQQAQQQAENRAAGLGPLLQQIASDAQGGQGILSVADIEARYGSRLAAYRAPGFDVRQFVISRMGACFRRADRRIRRDMRRSSSELGQRKAAIEEDEATIRTGANEKLLQYQDLYSDTFSELTQNPAPLNLSACRRSKIQGQMNCLSQLRDNLTGVLNGTNTAAGIDINISGRRTLGNGGPTAIKFRCAGLNGCIRTLQTVRTNVQRRVYELQANLVDRTQTFTRATDNFVTSASQALQSQSSLLNRRLDDINQAMTSMGLRPLDLGTVQPQDLQPDGGQPPLPMVPQDMASLIGGRMDPPMLDVAGGRLNTDAQGALADGRRDVEEEFREANQAKREIEALRGECIGERNRELADDAIRAISNCAMAQEACMEPGRQRFEELTNAVYDIQPSEGLSAGRVTSLQRGVNGMCDGFTEYGPRADSANPGQLARCRRSMEGAISRVEGLMATPACQPNGRDCLIDISSIVTSESGCSTYFQGIPRETTNPSDGDRMLTSLRRNRDDIIRQEDQNSDSRLGQRHNAGCSIAEVEDTIYQLRDSTSRGLASDVSN
jgi:hypothetical protein